MSDASSSDPVPMISVVVITYEDTARVLQTIRSVLTQECPFDFEVIASVSGCAGTAEAIRRSFPKIRVIDLGRRASPGAARNAALAAARGKYVTFPGSHVTLAPGSLAARVAAHEEGYELVTVCTLNGTDTPAGWASYFLGHTRVLPGLPSEELQEPPGHCSYLRERLLWVGGFPDARTAEDTYVNRKLFALGARAFRAQEAVMVHHSPCVTAWRLCIHHFQRGLGAGRLLREESLVTDRRLWRRTVYFAVLYVPARVRRISGAVKAQHALWPRYRRVRHLVILGASAAWLGIWTELSRHGAGRALRWRSRKS